MSGTVIETVEISRSYGAVVAVDRVSLSVTEGERHAIIGPNGAGKSTLFGLVTGGIKPTNGTLRFDGRDITRTSQVKRARMGIAQTFQHASVFLPSTVAENVALAVQRSLGCCRNLWRSTARYRDVSAHVDECLAAVGLVGREDVVASELSHGERQQLEVAIALAGKPRVLLLDEPTAGMSQGETERFIEMVRGLPRSTTILIIEHDLRVVFSLAETVTVLHLAGLLASGGPADIRANPEVQAAYIGGGDTDLDLPEMVTP